MLSSLGISSEKRNNYVFQNSLFLPQLLTAVLESRFPFCVWRHCVQWVMSDPLRCTRESIKNKWQWNIWKTNLFSGVRLIVPNRDFRNLSETECTLFWWENSREWITEALNYSILQTGVIMSLLVGKKWSSFPSWAILVESSRDIFDVGKNILYQTTTQPVCSMSLLQEGSEDGSWEEGRKIRGLILQREEPKQIQAITMTYHYFLTCNLPGWRRWGAGFQKQMWQSLNICYYCFVLWLPNEKESHFYAMASLGPYGVV